MIVNKEQLVRTYKYLFRFVGTKNKSNRENWLKATLEKIPEGTSIIDAGAGEQQFKSLCDHLIYTSQDIAEYDGSGDQGLQTGTWDYGKLDIISDICDMPVENDTFDNILCTEVLEHVPDPAKVFPEFSRIIRSGGYLIITAPFCSLTHFAPYHYSSGFNKYYYEHHLSSNGFNILEISSNGNYFEYIAQELRRLKTVSKTYTNKKINYFDKIVINLLLNKLRRLSKKDQGSDTLLTYGYHILAQKK